MNESKTYIKNVIISPKKLRFYLKEIKKLTPIQALERLYYGKQKATKILYQAIKSAIANAKQTLKIDENLLKFKVFTIEEGLKLKRYQAGSRGTAKPILKRRSHIKIVLISEAKDLQNESKKQITQLKNEIDKEEKVDKNDSEKSNKRQVVKSLKTDKKQVKKIKNNHGTKS
ncbi:MAG: hypothetical protein Fur009_3040 [Candidatus Microgenomates bacterium]